MNSCVMMVVGSAIPVWSLPRVICLVGDNWPLTRQQLLEASYQLASNKFCLMVVCIVYQLLPDGGGLVGRQSPIYRHYRRQLVGLSLKVEH